MLPPTPRPMPRHQSGAALITGLLIMIIMTLIGISAMESSLVQTSLATNTQLNTIGFQTTEAALARADNDGALLGQTINNGVSASPPDTGQAVLDQTAQSGGTVTVTTTIQANACGELPGAQCLEQELNANESANNATPICFAYQLVATTTIGNAQASSTQHTQTNSRSVPGQAGIGQCNAI